MIDLFGIATIPTTGSFSARDQYAFVCHEGSGIAAPSPEDVRLDQLASRRTNWDGHGSPAPSAVAVNVARAWGDEVKLVTESCGRPWAPPLVGSSADGEITLEWWSDSRKLTLYFSEDSADYVRTWGTHIENEMDSGELVNSDEFRDLWNWLLR